MEGTEENRMQIWIGQCERKRPSGRPKGRCEDNVRMYLKEVGWGIVGRVCIRIGTSGGLL